MSSEASKKGEISIMSFAHLPAKKLKKLFVSSRGYALIILGMILLAGFWWQRGADGTQPIGQDSSAIASTVKARVVEILEAGQIDLGGSVQAYQVLTVEALEGEWAGMLFEIDYGRRQLRAPGPPLQPGDEVIITVSQVPGQEASAYFADFVRTPALAILLGAFVVFTVLISGWKGVRSLLAMAISLTVILEYILPNVLLGKDPVVVSLTGAFMILAITLYLVYGWTLKTHAAVLGTLIALTLTGLLASFFVTLTRMTGFGSEEAMFLSQQPNAILNFRGLVLGGIIIGSLGVIDDLVITQASAIFELYLLDPKQSVRALFQRGMRIGQDHAAATVNTLVLAYTGAALPLLLLVSGGSDWFNFLNRESVAEEIVRTLVGSLGLLSAVPMTTAIASVIAKNIDNLRKLQPFLGPAVRAGDEVEVKLHHH